MENDLRLLVRNTQDRYNDYNKLLADYFKSKIDLEWYKDHLRFFKNFEEKRLETLNEQITNLRQGMN
jgi:hypothetical protein